MQCGITNCFEKRKLVLAKQVSDIKVAILT